MIRDISYIIKRIIIGVGIALTLMFLKGSLIGNVYAFEVDKYNIGETITIVDNMTTHYDKTISGAPWSSLAGSYGYINGTFSLSKVDGTATSINIIPKQVYVNTGNNSYVCNINSPTITNSTFNSATYSYRCPIQMSSSGLTGLVIQFVDIQTNFPSMSRLVVGSLVSFEIHNNQDVNVSVDTSGTTNAINNQTQSIINNQNSNNQAIISNDNSNTQSIINNQNSNNQAIINNQNSNTDKEIKSQQVCTRIDKSYIVRNNRGLGGSGGESYSSGYGITDYISIPSSSDVTVFKTGSPSFASCFYNSDKELISCINNSNYSNDTPVNLPTGTSFARFTIKNDINSPQFDICTSGNQAIVNSQQQINNTINDDNVDGANTQASSFFDNFQSNSHGLSGVITAPLRLINSLTTATCSPLQFQLPFVHNNVSLPCMRSIYEDHFGVFFSLYQLITTGLICYLVMINLYSKIHNLQNPNNDRIEVLNL